VASSDTGIDLGFANMDVGTWLLSGIKKLWHNDLFVSSMILILRAPVGRENLFLTSLSIREIELIKPSIYFAFYEMVKQVLGWVSIEG